jgi:hypothetical protein
MTKGVTVKPLGATDGCPLVVQTRDLAVFLRRHLSTGRNGQPVYDKVVMQIKTCKEHGQIHTGVSYEVLKRINLEANIATADNVAEAILISQGASDQLGKDIPLYRNPYLTETKYITVMKKRLKQGWIEDLDGPLDEEELLAYVESFPEITPP